MLDKALEATKGLNKRLTADENLWQLHSLMIFCGALMDVMILSLFINWVIRGTSVRLVVVFSCFYGLRAICMMVYAVEPYEGYYWEYPGFPSLIIAYGETNDFFYSGHVGACILCFHEYTKNGWTRFRWYCIFTAIMQVIVLLITRGHFFIDLVSGAIFADWLWHKVNNQLEKCESKKNTTSSVLTGELPTDAVITHPEQLELELSEVHRSTDN